ncbi:GyrI-like domain-containing protein [Agromyces arachidis]|uniref:GyrI-like domain-containing protein n=1 Tax=Agromyces arachidis TaxID=766966 RepID=UPI004056C888
MSYDVRIITVPERHLAAVRTTTAFAGIPAFMGDAFGRVAEHLGRARMPVDGPAAAKYTGMDPAADRVEVSAGFVVARPIEGDGTVVPDVLPAGEVATAEHLGAYARVSEAYDAIAAAMALHGRELDESAMWEEYWSPPGTPDDQTRTVVFCPLVPSGAPTD